MKVPHDRKQTLIFLLISITLMVGYFILSGGAGFGINVDQAEKLVNFDDDSPVAGEGFEALPQPDMVDNEPPRDQQSFLRLPHDHPLIAEFFIEEIVPQTPTKKPVKPKPLPRYTLKNTDKDAPARIAIIIDDMGMNRVLSRKIGDIKDVPLTLAYLPYAENLESLTQPAQENGHELIIHMPMEAMDRSQNLGPIALKDTMSKRDVEKMLDQAFDAFDGYVGLNNHMGSRVTQNSTLMGWVMDALEERDLFYVDSKTISTSVAARTAQEYGLDYATRDVFLDHEDTDAFVRKALQKTEALALKKGHAIAIGHPKDVTLRGLEEWIPTLNARGFEIVPVSELLLTPAPEESKIVRAEDLLAIEPAAGHERSRGLYALPD